MTLVKLVWILIRNLCHLFCQIPCFWTWMLYVFYEKHFCFTHFYSNKSPCFSPINWDCIKWLILIMQMLECYYLSLPWVTRLGTTHLPISWQKGGVGYGKGSCNLLVQMCKFGENSHWGGVTLWGGALHFSFIAYMV